MCVLGFGRYDIAYFLQTVFMRIHDEMKKILEKFYEDQKHQPPHGNNNNSRNQPPWIHKKSFVSQAPSTHPNHLNPHTQTQSSPSPSPSLSLSTELLSGWQR